MIHEALADNRALARQHLQHVLGNAGFKGELTNANGSKRRYLGGLEHDRAAGSECRSQAPASNRHREVPGHDHADNADGLLEGHVDATGHGYLSAEQALGRAAVVLQHVRDVVHFPAGVADGVAGVHDLEQCEFILMGTHDIGEATQQVRAITGSNFAPCLQCLVRTGDGLVGLLERGRRNSGDNLFGGRVDDAEHGAP